MVIPANDLVETVTSDALASGIRLIVGNASFETTPKQARKIDAFARILPKATPVFIAFIPGETAENMIEMIRRLAGEGMVPVPHIPARSMKSAGMFESYVSGAADAGADHALIVAGGMSAPEGPYDNSRQLLETGLLEQAGFQTLFVAGHPEGSPDISADEVERALAFKNDFARQSGLSLKIATQFSFDGAMIRDWESEIAAKGNHLPVRVGLAGPASIASLMRYATMCGVRASSSFLSRSGAKALKLVGSRAPDDVLTMIARCRIERPMSLIEGVHMYPFGGFEKTAQWITSVRQGDFSLSHDRTGFTLRV